MRQIKPGKRIRNTDCSNSARVFAIFDLPAKHAKDAKVKLRFGLTGVTLWGFYELPSCFSRRTEMQMVLALAESQVKAIFRFASARIWLKPSIYMTYPFVKTNGN